MPRKRKREQLQQFTAPEEGRLNVCAKQCRHCLFGADPLVSWSQGGKEIVERALKLNTHFTCHRFTNSMCRGFFDRYFEDLPHLKFSFVHKLISWVRQPKERIPWK
jgi:hypothetical protein